MFSSLGGFGERAQLSGFACCFFITIIIVLRPISAAEEAGEAGPEVRQKPAL
jgi:hypothetical protein